MLSFTHHPVPKPRAPRVALIHSLDVNDVIPWRTVPAYYRGSSPLGVRGDAPRRRTLVYRVTGSFVPAGK